MNNTNKLTGVVIDAGHGGSDSGAIGENTYEKDYNLLISQYMYNRLKELGIPVYITRDSDETITPANRTKEILEAFGNDPNVVVISNHLNAGGGTGAEVIYALRNNSTLANKVLNNIGDLGQTKRKVYQRRLPSDNSKDYYFIHRNTGNTEPLIVEYGFIDNPQDLQFLKNNYQQLAEATIKAILDYKGIPYTAPNEVATNTYKVSKGDTLYSIAQKFNTTVDTLKRLNNLANNTLTIGQVLQVPTSISMEEGTQLYTVKRGDTLYTIANNFNTTVDNIKSLNNLTSNTLSIGQILIVPTGTTTSNTYRVRPGDSLYSIAKQFNTTVDELKRANNLTNNFISVNQELKIPSKIEEETQLYTVKSGDTLYSIAKENNTTVQNIKNANNLTSDILTIGTKLIIPTPETTYVVKPGDNLYQIARKYGTTVDNIKALNNLTTNNLSVGQILVLR